MDRLDRFSIWAIVILIIGSSALISHHMSEAKPERNVQRHMSSYNSNPAVSSGVENRVRAAKNLMAGNNINKAGELAGELIKQYPYEGEPHMLMGDILMRKQEPVKAIFEYREAVDLNPDYLDKKTPLFQGKKLKMAVGEALTEIENRIKADPGNDTLRKHRKDIYYLQRRIAGSCG